MSGLGQIELFLPLLWRRAFIEFHARRDTSCGASDGCCSGNPSGYPEIKGLSTRFRPPQWDVDREKRLLLWSRSTLGQNDSNLLKRWDGLVGLEDETLGAGAPNVHFSRNKFFHGGYHLMRDTSLYHCCYIPRGNHGQCQ